MGGSVLGPLVANRRLIAVSPAVVTLIGLAGGTLLPIVCELKFSLQLQ
jgi:hypothetical protein